MKRTLTLILALLCLFSAGFAESDGTQEPIIGIAWCQDVESEFFTNICRAIEVAGGQWIMLDQVQSPDLAYDDQGKLLEGVDENGILEAGAAKSVRVNTWHGSNAAEAVGNVNFVIFTGGADISPSLYYEPEEWNGLESEKDYSAERDVSDYLTMSYCLDNDIPLIGFCRGMQVLSVVSGASLIQDLPTYFAEHSTAYGDQHRNRIASLEDYRDYAAHDVQVAENSLLYQMVKTNELVGCPSWHHQAVKSVDNTRLAVTGTAETNGISIIEAVERTDKTFAVGLQFHPEAAVAKYLDDADNKNDFTDYDTALSIFRYIVREFADPAGLQDAA